MKIYTDAPIGTALKLRVETTESEAANELDVLTTVSGEWATYHWDFSGDPPIYNVLTFMLGYGSPNDASPQATFLFDDIQQTNGTVGIADLESSLSKLSAYPNPATDQLTIRSEREIISSIVLFDPLGKEVKALLPNQTSVLIDVADLTQGVYFARITTFNGTSSLRIIIE